MRYKLQAVRRHRSQVAQYRYDRAALGLNQYRGVLARRCRYAEMFDVASEGLEPRAAAEIMDLVAPGGAFVLVDERWLPPGALPERRAIPFLERDNQYWGPPADDATAIRELERLRRAGAGHIVFAWPAFWWLDYYAGFHRHLRSRFRCVLENERVLVFEL